jgi:hypothetical protein
LEPALAALWAKVLEDWSNEERHRALLEFARAQGRLAEASSLYRAVAAEVDADGAPTPRAELAKRKLGAIVTIAMLELEGARAEPLDHGPKRLLTWLAFVLLLGVLVTVGWALRPG